jgi:hypothetical protein
MAEAIYEVNIKLNAQNFEQELNTLKKKLERFTKEAKRKNEKDPIFKRGRELTVLKSIETTRNKLNELDRFGLNTDKRRAKLRQAEELVSKGKFRTAKNLVNEAQLLNLKDAENLRLAKERLAEEKKLKREREMQQKLASKRVGSVIKSAAIGGGFPLLFGGGITQAIPGLLGGALGEAASPGGGFAGSIAATALASSATQFANSAREVGNALKDPTEGLQKLKDAGFQVSESTERQIEALIKAGRKTEALELVQKEFAKTIGTLGVDNLKKLDNSFDELDDATAKLILKIQADLAPAFFTIIDLATKFVDSIGAVRIRVKAKELDLPAFEEARKKADQAAMAVNPNRLFGGRLFDPTKPGPASDAYYRVLNEESKKIIQKNLPGFLGMDTGGDGTGSGDPSPPVDVNLEKTKLEKLVKQTEHYERILEVGFEQAELEKQIAEFKESASEAELEKIKNGEINIKQLIQENQKAEQLVKNAELIRDAFRDLTKNIATDLADGIQGLIRGTSTLNDVLNNVLNKMIDAAFNMALFGNAGGTLTKGLGLFGNLFGGFLSTGGRGGKSYIVGERGPELFTPGVSGMVSPNNALGGSTNVVVNVDASGSNVQGDEEQGRELGRLISVAVQSEILQQKRPGGLLA